MSSGKCHGTLCKDIHFKIKCNSSFIVDVFSKTHGSLEILPMWVSYQFFQSHCTLFSSPTLLLVSKTVVLKVHFGICSDLTALCLPLLATKRIKITQSKAITDHQSRIWLLQPESIYGHATVGQHCYSSSM